MVLQLDFVMLLKALRKRRNAWKTWLSDGFWAEARLCAATLGFMGVNLSQVTAVGKPGKTGRGVNRSLPAFLALLPLWAYFKRCSDVFQTGFGWCLNGFRCLSACSWWFSGAED